MCDLTPEKLAELRQIAELANDLPGGSDWLHGEVGDGTETVAEWMGKCSASPDAPAAGSLRVVWSEGIGEKCVTVQAIVGDTEAAPIRAAFIANANPAVVLALLDAAAERDALAADADKWQRAALTLQGDRDVLRAELAHMREARDDARAEVERLTVVVDAVRAECAQIARDCDAGFADPYEVRPVVDRITAALGGEADQ